MQSKTGQEEELMTANIAAGAWVVPRVALTLLLGLAPTAAMAQIEGPQWNVIEIGGKPVATPEGKREPHVSFRAGGRLSGSDGCNRVTGSYKLKGETITLARMAWTEMACVDTPEIAAVFRDALKRATRFTVTRDRLELFDAGGDRLAAFARGADHPE
jgi:heat shock protein HslJ